MEIIVCSNKFDKYINKWISIAEKNKFIKFTLINDSTSFSFSNYLSLISDNINHLSNNENIGKVKSVISYIINQNVNDWIIVFDDKDEIILEDLSQIFKQTKETLTDKIFVADCLSFNGKIIGDSFINDYSLKKFIIQKGKLGDKSIIFNTKKILDNKDKYEYFLKFSCHIYESILYLDYMDSPSIKIKPIIRHIYNKDGITLNNLENKLNNYEFYLWETKFYLDNNPSFSVLISRLFILWLLRKKGTINLCFSHKALYFMLKTLCLFPLLKKIYLYRLKKLIAY